MNIAELLGEETLKQYSERLMHTLGIKRLGRGNFAQVFQHPVYHNVAVKVVKDDPGYIKYAWFCMKNPTNPWLPKIIDVVDVKIDDDDYDEDNDYWRRTNKKPLQVPIEVVFFEKLRPASSQEIYAAVQKVLADVPSTELVREFFWDFTSFNRDTWHVVATYTTDPDLKQFAQLAHDERFEDIHNGNVMMRGNQLVFTDPVC